MARLGRRQPHAPIINRGGLFQPPVARAVVVSQSVAAGAFARRPRGAVILRGLIQYAPPAPTTPVAVTLVVQRGAQEAGVFARRPRGAVLLKRPGTPPSVARSLVVSDALTAGVFARRPRGTVILRGLIQYALPPPTAPVGASTVVTRGARDAARVAFRPLFRPLISRPRLRGIPRWFIKF